MSITTSCSCGKRLKLSDTLAGKRVKCPECGQPLEVPKADEPAAEVFGLAPLEAPPCPECGKKMKRAGRRCTHCGFDIRTGRKRDQTVSESAGVCPVCDGPMGRLGCPSCGEAQAALSAANKTQQTPDKKGRLRCPSCGSLNCVKISAGAKAAAGILRWGGGLLGSILAPRMKTYRCKDCSEQW